MTQEWQGCQEKLDIKTSRLQEVIHPISAHKPQKVGGPGTKVLSNQANIRLGISDVV